MGQVLSNHKKYTPRQPKGVEYQYLKNSNYERIVYPPYKTHEKQVEYIKSALLRRYEEPIILHGIKIEYYLPKGVTLYHGSLDFYLTFDKPCITCEPNHLTFFGLDITISLWYLYELYLNNGSNRKFGIIYEFEVIEDIPVFLIEEIDKHPFGWSECNTKGIACIHPQYAYHGIPVDVFHELSIELTMDLSDDILRKSIRRKIHPIEDVPISYMVDIKELENMVNYGDFTIHQLNPIRPNRSHIDPSLQNKLPEKIPSVLKGIITRYNKEQEEKTKGGGTQKRRRQNRRIRKEEIAKKRTIRTRKRDKYRIKRFI